MIKTFHEIGEACAQRARIPVGRPLPNCRVRILDGSERPVPPGEVGQVSIEVPFPLCGYLDDPERTGAAFRSVPGTGSSGLREYLTGDLGRIGGDGLLEMLGRIDDQVKVDGQRVELGEIEQALLQHPKVVNAAVIHEEDEALDSVALHAFVVAADDCPIEQLRDHVASRLGTAFVPRTITRVAAIPRGYTGKTDRVALQRLRRGRETIITPYAEPRTEVQARVVSIWQSVLGDVPIGIEDSFWDWGGGSLFLARLAEQIDREFGVEIHLASLLQAVTPAAQARLVVAVNEISHGSLATETRP